MTCVTTMYNIDAKYLNKFSKAIQYRIYP